jgi:RNA-binding protein YlmH
LLCFSNFYACCKHFDVFFKCINSIISAKFGFKIGDVFGDLIALDDRAYLLALPEVASRLPMEWDKAGSTPIKVQLLEEAPEFEPPKGDMLRDTVASMRLDCILASGMKTSRSRAAEIIRTGAVSVDHMPEERTDRVLEAGALLSIRGFGRIRVREVGSPTRKDRLPVQLEIFHKS